ncbi:MAG: dUTP diphosphatase [Prolixibacteraceae bacterium]|nr:dUTP diphosphatase [Prolixibacteraceae bacterium]
MKIKIIKLRPNAILPKYQTKHSAGMDLHAAIDEPIVLKQRDIYAVPVGIAVGIPEGYEMQVRGRSGLALKHGVAPAAGVGTIDADFRGEIHAILINNGKSDFVINPGDRIAQAIIAKYEKAVWQEVKELNDTERGVKGFGSTGKN